MSRYYPIMLNLRGRSVVIVGGDRIAAEKASALAACGARVTVLAATFCDELCALAAQPDSPITLRPKSYAPGDLAGASVVIATTRDPDDIAALQTETRQRGQLLNVVDVPAACDFITPSILRRGPLIIAVSTQGASPSLAKRLRHRLEALFPPAYDAYLRLAAAARHHLRAAGVSYDRRDAFFAAYDTSDVLARLVADDITGAASLTAALLRDYTLDVPAEALEEALHDDAED